MKKIRTAALSLLTAGALAGGVALAGPAAGSDAYCTAGAPAPDTIYGKDKYKLAYTRAAMTCRSGYIAGPDWTRAPYLPEIIIGMNLEASLQSKDPDGVWRTRSSGQVVGEQEGTIFLTLSSRCTFATVTEWRVVFTAMTAATYGGREVILTPYTGRVSSLACG